MTENAGTDVQLHRLHRDARVLVKITAGFQEDLLARGESPLEDVAVPVQKDDARLAGRDEPVEVHPAPAVQDVGQPLDALETVAHRVRGSEERVLPDVDLHGRMEQ